MLGEMVRVFGDRPGHVDVPSPSGGTVRVSIAVHDGWYLRERARRRRLVAAAHPDPSIGGTGNAIRFARVKRQYEGWKTAEVAWYATYGLLPPMPSAVRFTPATAPPPRAAPARVHRASARQRILAYRVAHPDASLAETMDAAHASRANVKKTLLLARRGARVLGPTQGERVEAILQGGALHTVAELAAAAHVSTACVGRLVADLRARAYRVVTVRLDRQNFYQLMPATWGAINEKRATDEGVPS